MNYGMPYVGSKNKIAENIIAQLPPAKHFYDCFGGGGAISHCALLSGKYDYVHYNELNPLIYKAFKMAINGEFKNENKWISRDDFFRLKDTDPYVAICFSFGYDLQSYAYTKDIEQFKKALHYSIVFNDNSLLNQMIDLKDFKYSSKNIKERRSELHSLLKKSKLDVEYGKPNQPVAQHQIWLERLQSLESLERLERLENINNERLLLSNLSYEEVPIESDSVIYCDPPYLKVVKQKRYNNSYFNHNEFYEWCRKQNNIFISEYTMPDDFKVLYQKEKICSLGLNNNTKTVEKLFVNMGYESVYTQMNLF